MKRRIVSSVRVAAIAALTACSTSLAAAEPAAPIVNSLGMKLAPIPAGKFQMGQDGPPSDYQFIKHPDKFDDADWDERPAHEAAITRPFQRSMNRPSPVPRTRRCSRIG